MTEPACQCGRIPMPWPALGECDEACQNKVDSKHSVMCRPCALGNHTGDPCGFFERDHPLIQTCATCGFKHD